MNPARTFGPDLVRNVTGYWVYLAGPIAGAASRWPVPSSCAAPAAAGPDPPPARRPLHPGSAGAGVALTGSRTALVDAVGRLVDAAVHRVLLGDDRVTSAAEAKLRLSGQDGTEELADKVQRVVVLATPVVRLAARGARFTRLPWAMVASSSVSIGIAVRAGVREIQVLSSLVAYRIEQATGAPADPRLVEKVAVDRISTRSGGPTSRMTGFGSFDSPGSGCRRERSDGPPRSGPAKHSRRPDQARRQRSLPHAGTRSNPRTSAATPERIRPSPNALAGVGTLG